MKEKGRPVFRFKVVGLVVLPIIVLAAAVVVPNLWPGVAEETHPQILDSMRRYVYAQEHFRKKDRYGIGRRVFANPVDGTGFPDLWDAGGADSGRWGPQLIPRAMAEATAPSRALHGYYLLDIVGDRRGLFDFTRQHGLCAVPVDPAKLTFIVDSSDKVYQKATHGRPVTVWPDLDKDGWLTGQLDGGSETEGPVY